jgi:hypothetical protein
LPLVLQIQASEELELGARQAGEYRSDKTETSLHVLISKLAAIYFKNCVHKHWSRSTKGLAEEDKAVIKKNILHAFITAPAAVQ